MMLYLMSYKHRLGVSIDVIDVVFPLMSWMFQLKFWGFRNDAPFDFLKQAFGLDVPSDFVNTMML